MGAEVEPEGGFGLEGGGVWFEFILFSRSTKSGSRPGVVFGEGGGGEV